MPDELVALILGMTAIAGITVVLLPVSRALARRLAGDPRMERRVAALETVLADAQQSEGVVRHLEARVARMERRVKHRGDARRAERSPRSAETGPPKVGKLWTPPPYEA